MIKSKFVLIIVCAIVAQSSGLTTSRSRRNVDTCGVAKIKSGFIVRGQSFTHGAFPWIVALLHTGTRPPKFFCGGTLISKTFVVSAAHCILEKRATQKFLPRDVLALFGAHDLNDPYESGRISLSPKKIYIHDDWNHLTTSFDADVSLLEFEPNRIHFDDFIQPICLWDLRQEPAVSEGTVTGWGRSEDVSKVHENMPKKIKVKIQSNLQCLPGQPRFAELASERTFCAGLKDGSGVCHGDSGGGLFVEIDGTFFFKGIVSSSLLTSFSECDTSKNAVYTNLLEFRDWIRKKTVAVTQAFCIFAIQNTWCCSEVKTCEVRHSIDSENYVLASPINRTVEKFWSGDNKEMKFLPSKVGEKFPNLKEFNAENCELTIVRNFHFKDMQNLQDLLLLNNKIRIIESGSFDDLINVRRFGLDGNLIETLDENLFKNMVNLEELRLEKNKIKFLSPSTIIIPGGKLRRSNVCLDNINGFFMGGLRRDCKT